MQTKSSPMGMLNSRKLPNKQKFYIGFFFTGLLTFLYFTSKAVNLRFNQNRTVKIDTISPWSSLSINFDESSLRVQRETSIWEHFKAERASLISRAEENGEDLLLRGKLWKLFRPTWSCPYSVERLGRAGIIGDGGKWMCGIKELYSNPSTSSNCVVYSFGVNTDSSFESDVLNKTQNCQVFAYDYTVNNIGPPLSPSTPRVHFQKLGMADNSEVSKASPETFKTLKEFMTLNNHEWIDILKIDVEGAEFDSLNKMMDDFPDFLPIGQLQIEFHIWMTHSEVYSKAVGLLLRLEERGMKAFRSEPNPYDPALINIDCSAKNHSMSQYEYSFLNTNWKPFWNSSFTFEQLLMGSAINTYLHLDNYPIVDQIEYFRTNPVSVK